MASTPEEMTTNVIEEIETDENMPLLDRPKKKPFYRPRPLWLVPFAVLAALVRGMTLAPRVEVFTQLACNRLHGDHNWNHTQFAPVLQQLHTSLYTSIDPLGPHFIPTTLFSSSQLPRPFVQPNASSPLPIALPDLGSNDDTDRRDSDETEDPRRIPSARCQADPAVQAGAARLQMIMTTLMGLLSTLTTVWWGNFGDRHGRTRVLAISTLGLFLTDLMFILVSTPGSPLSKHGHYLLLVAPIIEGSLGGYSTLQSATSAYLSDCTSPGSRAKIFSRFQGVVYLGFAVGPSIGGWLIKHPFGPGVGGAEQGKVVTTVFWVAIACSFFNLLMVTFVFPESLNKKKMEALAQSASAKGKARAVDVEATAAGAVAASSSSVVVHQVQEAEVGAGVIARLLSPLAIFLPVMVLDPSPNGLGSRKRRDWSLTMLAVALFGFMLSTGLYQIKYLYATHTYGWGPEQLSYYISFMGGGRALWLLCGLPALIGFFKPKPLTASSNAINAKSKTNTASDEEEQATSTALVKGKKPKPTREQLGQEIGFDLILTRCALLIDVVSHSLVAILPSPAYKAHMESTLNALATPNDMSFNRSQAMFVVASSLNGLGSGSVPAIHSLALCMLQVRALNAQSASGDGQVSETETAEEGTGALFGALAVLQAIGQMILGPMLFGLVYSNTVATFPKTIFILGAGIMVFALTMMMLVRNPVRVPRPVRSPPVKVMKKRKLNRDVERGRSRVSKDLRGGAIRSDGGYGSTGSTGSSWQTNSD